MFLNYDGPMLQIEDSGCHLEQYLLGHWQPVKNVAKNRNDVANFSSIDEQLH